MKASILVVDDERAIQDTLAWCLRDDGHGVRTAGSGEEAMVIMADQGFDLVISDIIMPGLSGVDLLRKAHVLQPQTLFALSEDDGHVLATQSVANGDQSSPTLSDGAVFVSYACNQAYGFSQTTLAPLWHYSTFCSGGKGSA